MAQATQPHAFDASPDAGTYFWALISPSARHSVSYLRSSLASSWAAGIHWQCGEYLALVKLSTCDVLGEVYGVAYLVQPSSLPLPETYLPIAPCRIGPREPLYPGFEWPFEQCVIDTGNSIDIDPVSRGAAVKDVRWKLPNAAVQFFRSICKADRMNLTLERVAQRKIEQKTAGLTTDDGGTWTSFSSDSIEALPRPGQFYAPLSIKVQIQHDISSLKQILPARFCFDDVLKVKRCRAQCSRPAWEETVRWTQSQASCAVVEVPAEKPTIGLCNPALIDFSLTIDRPWTPGRDEDESVSIADEDQSASPEFRWGSWHAELIFKNRFPSMKFPPQYHLIPGMSLQILYLDIYGTLIDNESGIFDALHPLLAQSSYRFERHEALSHYFELESDVKKRAPSMPYIYVLAQTYIELALRLGLACGSTESTVFASSFFHWPLYGGALECLRTLRPLVSSLIALLDVDVVAFSQAVHYPLLAPYFSEAFTHDQAQVYRPDPLASTGPFGYHDSKGIARGRRLVVSNSMYRDLEPAMNAPMPCVWMRHPTSLAARLPITYSTLPWRVCEKLDELPVLIRAEEEKGKGERKEEGEDLPVKLEVLKI